MHTADRTRRRSGTDGFLCDLCAVVLFRCIYYYYCTYKAVGCEAFRKTAKHNTLKFNVHVVGDGDNDVCVTLRVLQSFLSIL